MAGKSRSTDGELKRGYSVRCAMPGCTNFRALNSDVLDGKATKKRAIKKLRSEGWSDRDVIGWTCGGHDGHERRKVKREETAPDASGYGFEHA
jgi:hypothetical protein